jgi:prepilin-type N-terminal cleavage/methylation domain-containing protein
MKKFNQKGFTLVELLIASMIFSLVLLLCVTAMLQIGRMYYKGITTARTQEAARSVLESLSQSVQFSTWDVVRPDATNPARYCIDNRQYSFVLGQQLVANITVPLDETRRSLVRAEAGGCPPATPLSAPNAALSTGWRELMPEGMRLSNLVINESPAGSGRYQITVRVVSGDGDLMTDPNGVTARCNTGLSFGGQFCAVSELSTVVQKRL